MCSRSSWRVPILQRVAMCRCIITKVVVSRYWKLFKNNTFERSKKQFYGTLLKKGRSFYWNATLKKMVITYELARIPSLTRESKRQNQTLTRIFAEKRWFVEVPCLYLVILVNRVLLYLRKDNQIHIMIFYVEFNWDSQALSNGKNTCLYRG